MRFRSMIFWNGFSFSRILCSLIINSSVFSERCSIAAHSVSSTWEYSAIERLICNSSYSGRMCELPRHISIYKITNNFNKFNRWCHGMFLVVIAMRICIFNFCSRDYDTLLLKIKINKMIYNQNTNSTFHTQKMKSNNFFKYKKKIHT